MYTLDRFARNRYDSAIYKAKLKRNGVKIFYAKQPMPDTPEGIILESVLEGYAEYYSENLARSIKRGMKENALHGIAMGSPVLGYKIGNDRQYEIDPVDAKAVRTIFTMYAEGKSKTQIVNWLNEHGFKTSRGNAFNKNSLSRILRNDKYIGVYRYDDVVLEDAVPPIIDKTLFDKVQATFQHNYTARAKAKAIEDYLLTTKVFCGHCGEPMVGESGTSKTGKVHHYYKCVNRKRKHNCEKKVEKKEWLERTVVEFTVQQVLTDENIEKISTRAMELIEKELQDTSVLIGLQERLKETNKRIKNLMSAIEQGIITPTTKERLEELEEERRDLEGQIAREEMKKPLLTKERIMYWLESFKRGDIKDVEYQRRIIDTLVNSVYVYDDGDKGRKLVLTFNISGNNTLTISSSDIERTAPVQTMDKIKSLIPGLKNEDSLDSFWEGAISDSKLGIIPVYIPNLMDSTSKLLDKVMINRIIHQAIPDLDGNIKKVIVYYIDITDEAEIQKFIKEDDSTNIEIELRDLKTVLDDVIIGDYAEIHTEETHDDSFVGYCVMIDKFISDRVLSKIIEFNQKSFLNSSSKKPYKPIQISDEGLELIEFLSIDCTADEGEWHSDSEIKIDKNGFVIINGTKTKDFWDGSIRSENKPLRLKIRNICGDETVWEI